jgi:hypothetical protein
MSGMAGVITSEVNFPPVQTISASFLTLVAKRSYHP